MGIGGGLFLVAVGAVLTWGVNATISGLNIHTIGVMLMIVGAVGFLLDLLFFMPRRRRTSVVSTSNGYGPGYAAPGAPVGGGSTVVQDQTYV